MFIGVDTGGTFTDFVALANGRVLRLKLPSTPHDPGAAVARGVEELDPSGEAIVVHGTTVATNALLERRLAKVTFVTNRGLEDVIEIGRQARPDLYALDVIRTEPLVPPSRRIGVAERTRGDGSIATKLTAAETKRVKREVAATAPEAIAIGLLYSFLEPGPERAIEEALRSLGLPISTSSAIAPSIREFERFSTTIANAALTPKVAGYLERLERALAPRRLFVFASNGGRVRAKTAAIRAVDLVLSGPAGGAVAAARVARYAGLRAAIALDMGGTSTDVALVRGVPERRSEIEIAGFPLLVPSLDIETVGSGGGSIAAVDSSGVLCVGPESAGADPGPACYGRGDAPTVTDAHVVLGRLPLELTSGVHLDLDRAERAVHRLGRRLGRDTVTTALAILDIADATMARAARRVAVNRSADPHDLELITFGGAGGLHAARLAHLLRCRGALVPAMPGHLSALGMLLADPEVDLSRTVLLRDPERRLGRLEREFRALEREARDRLRHDGGVPRGESIVKQRGVMCRYVGQTFTLEVPFVQDLRSEFHRRHREAFGHAFEDRSIEIVDLRSRMSAPRNVGFPTPPRSSRRGGFEAARTGSVRARFDRHGTVELPCYRRDLLRTNDSIPGPARIDDDGATIVVEPGFVARVDRRGNLRLTPT